MIPHDRGGSALVTVLAVLIGLFALAGGLLGLTLGAVRWGHAQGDALRARAAAEAGAKMTLAGPGRIVLPMTVRSVPPGAVLPAFVRLVDATAGYRVLPHRIDGEFLLLESTGEVLPDRAVNRQGLMVWILDPPTRLRRIPAVVQAVGQVSSIGRVHGHNVALPPSGWSTSVCATEQVTVDSVFASGWIKPVDHPNSSFAPWAPSVGLHSMDTLLVQAHISAPASATPIPSFTSLGCDRLDANNWGSPTSPGGPCGDHMPLVGRAGSLDVAAGEGQGMLVVDGDLTLRQSARYVGWILVSGSVRVDTGARVDGFVQAGGSVWVGGGGLISGSGCAALKALEALPELRTPRAVADGPWVEPL
jgi:hypothetical protein